MGCWGLTGRMQQALAASPAQPVTHSVYIWLHAAVFWVVVCLFHKSCYALTHVCGWVFGRLQESTGLADWGTSYGSLVYTIWAHGYITWALGYVIQVPSLLGGRLFMP